MTKEDLVTTIILNAFPGEKILPKHNLLDSFIDLYLPKHKLAIEID